MKVHKIKTRHRPLGIPKLIVTYDGSLEPKGPVRWFDLDVHVYPRGGSLIMHGPGSSLRSDFALARVEESRIHRLDTQVRV